MGATTDIDAGVAVVTLDWPHQRNALGPDEAGELTEALQSAAASPDVSAVVLTGRGAFCAGGHLPAIAALAAQGEDVVRAAVYGRFQGMMRALLGIPLPTIAAIDGPAVGLGFDLALACDSRFVGPGGWCRQGWGAVGLVPGTGGELLLRRLAPTLLWDLLADGTKLGPAEMEHLGLGRIAIASASSAAMERGRKLSALPRSTVEGYVQLHRRELRERMDVHLAACLDIQVGLICSEEFRRRTAEILGPPSS